MVIRDEQMDALQKSSIDSYAARVAVELRRQFAAKLTGTTDGQLRQLVHQAIGRAEPYGVVSEGDVKRYAEYMVEYGPDFDRNQWAQPTLTAAMSGSEKMDELDSYTTFAMRSDEMARRAKRPLNPAAVQAADDEIYQRHEDDPHPNPLYDAAGNRLPLSATDPAQTDLRREWMDLYVANGGQVEETSTDPTPPGGVKENCPGTPPPSPSPTPAPPLITETPVPPAKKTPAPTANLHVQLQHACDKSPLDKGKVEISGPESRSLPTGADGWAKFDGIKPGDYSIKGTHPQHYPGSTSANAPDAHTTEVKLPLQATIQIAATKAEYTVVLDKDGAAPAAFPMLVFSITKGPPNHLFDVQLSRDGAASFTGGPGLANSWVQADGRDARMNRHVFSSWANGQKTLKLDGSGNATFAMPLEWWRDQARHKLTDFTNFTYSFRVVAFR